MHLHCFQHVSFENAGTISEWATANSHTIEYSYFFEKDFILPKLTDIDVLLVMGGYMNADEEDKFSWLVQEKEFIRQAIASGKKVIGICLGAQLIASALGNKVYPAIEKEIGFFPVQFTDNALKHPLFNHFNNPYTVFHWHGDTFDLPENAQLMASTPICKHQAYLIKDKVLALQFHFEMNEAVIRDMLLHDGHELEEKGNYIQKPADILERLDYLKQNKKDLFTLLDKFLIE
jgi:GMP synthase-like glutamine amidotransferase